MERAFQNVIPPGATVQDHVTSLVAAKADRAIRPESIALGAFGVIAALAALTVGGQAIARLLGATAGDLEVLRAIGAGPAVLMADGLVGALGSMLLGALLAVGVAIALSPLGPIGPVRSVYPDRGVAFDWTVLGLGVVVIIVALGVLTVALDYRLARTRTSGLRAQAPARRQVLANAAAQAGLPAPVVAGMRFALDPGGGPRAVPVRSALLSMALAVVVVVATLTFGSGLQTLVSHPTLYGWNWTYALFSESGPDVPPQAVALLGHDAKVAAYSDVTIADPEINGKIVPSLFERANAAVVPAILSGHAPQGNAQIVLGAATVKDLGTHVGGTVTVTYGSKQNAPYYVPPTVLHVVGSATMPAIGFPSSEGDHTSMGIGALVPTGVITRLISAGPEDQPRSHPRRSRVCLRPDAPGSEPGRRPGRHPTDRLGRQSGVRSGAERRWYRRYGPGRLGSSSGRDRELPLDGRHAHAPGGKSGSRRGGRPCSHPRRIGASTAPGAGAVEVARLHRRAGVRVCSRAGDRDRALWPPRRGTARHRARAMAVGALRPRDLRRPTTDRAHGGDRRCGCGRGRARQRRCCVPRAYGCQNAVGADTAGRVK